MGSKIEAKRDRNGHANPAAGARDIGHGRPSDWSDQDLVSRVLAAEPGSFDELYSRYGQRVYRFALKRLRNPVEAEDITQEVFLQVHRSLSRFAWRSTLLTWIFGIANNQVRHHYRRKTPAGVPIEEAEGWVSTGSRDSMDRRLDAARMLASCGRVLGERVTPAQRDIFLRHYVGRQPIKSVARELGKSNQAVKIGLYRTRTLLGEHAARDMNAILN